MAVNRRRQSNDYYRGARARRADHHPESGHSRLSRSNLDYMAGYWDTDRELKLAPQLDQLSPSEGT